MRLRPIFLVVAAFFAACLFVNPVRTGAVFDDWAYAWTVKHWLETGQYRLHDWLSANMPFQALVGAAFCQVFGTSASSLRLSTLFLWGCGLIAFYRLAQEHELEPRTAALLTLGLLASPLVLVLSFSYMTDVPFLACILVSFFFYTRAIRLQSGTWMFAGSLAAAAAVLTRQFGVGLIAGLCMSWVATPGSRRRPLFYSLGAFAPTIAALWQIRAGIVDPNWCAISARLAEAQYWSHPVNALTQYLVRPPAAFHYFALFAAPFIPFACAALLSDVAPRIVAPLREWLPACVFQSEVSRVRQGWFLAAVAAWAIAVLCTLPSPFMPYLPWSFGFLADFGRAFSVLMLMFTLTGGLLIARAFWIRYRVRWSRHTEAQRFLDYATASLFVLQLAFYKLGDEYLLQFMPAVLIVLGWTMRSWISTFPRLVACCCLVTLLGSALWARALLEIAEAKWIAADSVLSQGVPPKDIYASWDWISYHRFNDYLTDIQQRPKTDFVDYFERWLPEQAHLATYIVGPLPAAVAAGEYKQVGAVSYRSLSFRKLSIPIWKRQP